MANPPYPPRPTTLEQLRDHLASEIFREIESLMADAPEGVAILLGYLLEHLYDARPAQTILRGARTSEAAFRDFYRFTGQNFVEFLTEKRLELARRMLLETEVFVSDIAKLIGFTRPGRLSAQFRKKYGMAPSRYREQLGPPQGRLRYGSHKDGMILLKPGDWTPLLKLSPQDTRDLVFTLLDHYLPGEGEP